MSCKCYNVTFKLRATAAAEGKSKAAAAREFKVDVQRTQDWCSQKEKLTVLKKSRKSHSPSLFIDVLSPDHAARHVRCSRRCHKSWVW